MTGRPYRDFADYYDRLMAGRYVSRWWWLFRRLQVQHGLRYRRVADLAGGTGEAARRLSGPGRTLFIVDRSAEMLARARTRVPGARLLRQDLRRLRLPEPVDLAVCVFGGINYLSSLARITAVARRVRRALAPGGVFCLDAVTVHHLNQRHKRGVETFSGAGYYSVWRYRRDPHRANLRIRVEGFRRLPGGLWSSLRPELHVHHAYPLPALRGALRRAGFSRVEAYGLPLGTPPRASDEYWLFWARA